MLAAFFMFFCTWRSKQKGGQAPVRCWKHVWLRQVARAHLGHTVPSCLWIEFLQKEKTMTWCRIFPWWDWQHHYTNPQVLTSDSQTIKYVLEILEMAQLGRCCDAILLRQAMHGDFYAVAFAALELSIRNISLLPAARSDCGGHEVNQISQEGLVLETQESI